MSGSKVLLEICVERAEQDQKWGGPSHDDGHVPEEWIEFISDKLDKASALIGDTEINNGDAQYRRRMIQIAALAVAAIESIDRKRAPKGDPDDGKTIVLPAPSDELLGSTIDDSDRKVRTRAGDSADALDAAMQRAPEVEWLTPEQRAESDEALERLHSGRTSLIRDAHRVAVSAAFYRDGHGTVESTLPTDTDRCLSTVPSDLPGPNVPRSLIGERCELDAHGHGSHRVTKGDEWLVWKDGQVVDSSVYRFRSTAKCPLCGDVIANNDEVVEDGEDVATMKCRESGAAAATGTSQHTKGRS